MVEPWTHKEIVRRIRWRHEDCDRTSCVATLEQSCEPTILLATLDAAPAMGLRDALESITRTTARPAGRGFYIEHVVDEGHGPGEECRFCAALAAAPPSHPDQVAKWDARARADAAVEDDIDMPDGYDPEGFNEPEEPHA